MIETCDAQCPAHSQVTVTKDGLQLRFCGHHYRKNEVALLVDGWQSSERKEPQVDQSS